MAQSGYTESKGKAMFTKTDTAKLEGLYSN